MEREALARSLRAHDDGDIAERELDVGQVSEVPDTEHLKLARCAFAGGDCGHGGDHGRFGGPKGR